MKELNKKFSINDVAIDRNSEDKDFAICEIWALSEGDNTHHNPFSREVLERDAHTFKGKFVIGRYDNFIKDVRGHEVIEDIYGYVSVDEEPQFKTKVVNGVEREFVVVKAYISKIYAKNIVDMFKVDNKRSVSCEFSCALQYDEDEYGRPIDENGVVIDDVNPVLGYSISAITILGKSVNPSVKEADMVMKRFSEDTNKLNSLEGEKMEDNKNFAEESKDEDIVMEEQPNQTEIDDTEAVKGDDKVDEVKGEPKEEKVEMSEEEPKEDENDKAQSKEGDSEKTMSEDEKDNEDEEKEMACGDKEMACGTEVEMADEESEETTEEDKEEEKSMSEKAIEFSDEEHKEFVEKLFSCELKECVEQIIELKKFAEDRIKADTEKRFSEIMVEPKLCLGEKAYNVLFEEGSKLCLSELDAFETKVKAFCEDAPKKREDNNDVLMFSCGNANYDSESDLGIEELIKKYN